MTANGAPIGEYRFRPAVASISFTLAFEEEEARKESGLTMAEYDALPGTPMWIDPDRHRLSKSDIIVLYRNANLIPMVGQDAAASKMERDAKMRRHR